MDSETERPGTPAALILSGDDAMLTVNLSEMSQTCHVDTPCHLTVMGRTCPNQCNSVPCGGRTPASLFHKRLAPKVWLRSSCSLDRGMARLSVAGADGRAPNFRFNSCTVTADRAAAPIFCSVVPAFCLCPPPSVPAAIFSRRHPDRQPHLGLPFPPPPRSSPSPLHG
jgi:hypothetical protein